MNYFAIPGLMKYFTPKELNDVIRKIEAACDLPKGAMKRKNSLGKPPKVYRGVCLSDIRMAMYVYFMDEVKLLSSQIAAALELDPSSVILGRKRGRELQKIKDRRFNTYYKFVKGITMGEEVKLPEVKEDKPVTDLRKWGNKSSLTKSQEADVFDMWEQGTTTENLSRVYGVTERTIYNVITRCRDRLQIAS